MSVHLAGMAVGHARKAHFIRGTHSAKEARVLRACCLDRHPTGGRLEWRYLTSCPGVHAPVFLCS